MNDSKNSSESVGTAIPQILSETLDQAKPVIGKMAERVNERIHDLAHQGKEAALEAKQKIESEARLVTSTAEHLIQRAPLKSVMVAAGVGVLAGVIGTWLMRERRP